MIIPLFYATILSLLLLCTLPRNAWSETGNPWAHSLYFENDLFTGTDSNYTNGVKYVLISPDLSPKAKKMGKMPKKMLGYIHKIPFIKNTPPQTSHKVEFALGQNMYTPSDISIYELIETDRPYAGWTYFATAYHNKSLISARKSVMDTLEIQLGIIGPASLAEQSQKFIHKIRDLDRPNGWDNQLSNEPGVVMAWERKWLYHPVEKGFGWDTIFHSGFTLGNVSTYVNGGMELRLGWNIPRTFGVSLIRPGGSTRMNQSQRPGVYLLGAVDGRWVARDIFLDGNTFRKSHSVEKEPWVAEGAIGLALNYNQFMITLTHVLRTRRFQEQPDSHSFGAISISWFF
ncbi:lipid A deacylase LpxR family protein [Desulfocicer vacuolatum]|nr:lipid A deacylase LpxR family protein [Desulfocicer vacuolatum]